MLSKVDYPFRSSGRLKEFARKFRRLLSRVDFLFRRTSTNMYLMSSKRNENAFRGGFVSWKSRNFEDQRIQKPATQKVFSRQATSVRLISFRHTIARTILMHAISDVREKYGTRATYRWFYQEHTFFANFHFPVAATIDTPRTRSYGIIYAVTCSE